MNLEEWKDKLYDSKDESRFADFADALDAGYWDVINSLTYDDDFDTQKDKIPLIKKQMNDVITDTFKYVIEDQKIHEEHQILLLKLLWDKLNKISTRINPEKVVASLNNNKRTEVAKQFKIFADSYNDPKHHEKYIAALNEIISKYRQKNNTPHPAVTSKKKTLIPSDDATATLEKNLQNLKKETIEYIESIKDMIKKISNFHTDSDLPELKENTLQVEQEVRNSKNVDELLNPIKESALLSQKLIDLCRKHDPNRAKEFSKENTSLLSKLIEHIKSFLNTIQRQFTSKATLNKRDQEIDFKNIQTRHIKNDTKNILKSLETLLEEIKSNAPTLNN